MNIVQCLSIQHGVILQQLAFLEKLKKEAQVNGDAEGVKQVLFCIADAAQAHAQIEEKFLFPELEPAMGKEMSPSAAVRFEHKEIREILSRLGKTDEAGEVLLETAKFIVFLRDHIAKEEKVLFPIAEKALGKKRLEELSKEVSAFQTRRFTH